MPDGYLVGPELLADIRQAVGRSESEPQGPKPGEPTPTFTGTNVQAVRVADPLVEHVDGDFTYVDGDVVAFNAASGELDVYGEVWLTEVNGRDLTAGEILDAIQSGRRDPGGGTRTVFAAGMPCCGEAAAASGLHWHPNHWK